MRTAPVYSERGVMKCVGEFFSGAQDTQTLFGVCGRFISKSISPARIPAALSAPTCKGSAKKTSVQR